jgi:hypothetical protein
VLDGNNGGNYYTVSLGDAVAGSISQKVLNATAAVNDKTYDGTTAATGRCHRPRTAWSMSEDRLRSIGMTARFTFVDRNAGNGKAVTVSGLTLAGCGRRTTTRCRASAAAPPTSPAPC